MSFNQLQTTELETRQAKERALAAVSAIVEEKPIRYFFRETWCR